MGLTEFFSLSDILNVRTTATLFETLITKYNFQFNVVMPNIKYASVALSDL